jgi:hypothetical protein
MAEISITAVKSRDYEAVLEATNVYFEKYNLRLVEERIGNRNGKFATAPKQYASLKDYEEAELKPYLDKKVEFTTNFDFFINLDKNPDWCVFAYPTRLAEYTLNIDEEFAEFISRTLKTKVFDYFNYTVVDQMIVRSFEDGESKDKLFIPGGDSEIGTKEGYFEKLEGLESEDLSEEELDKKADIIDGFWDHIGYNEILLEFYKENSRRPMYLKGKPEDIKNFLIKKKDLFYFV